MSQPTKPTAVDDAVSEASSNHTEEAAAAAAAASSAAAAASTRADGSERPPVCTRPGFVPEEEREKYSAPRPQRFRGVIIDWSHGFGFIKPDSLGANVFLHNTQLRSRRRHLHPGDYVEFERKAAAEGDKSDSAVNVRLVEELGSSSAAKPASAAARLPAAAPAAASSAAPAAASSAAPAAAPAAAPSSAGARAAGSTALVPRSVAARKRPAATASGGGAAATASAASEPARARRRTVRGYSEAGVLGNYQ